MPTHEIHVSREQIHVLSNPKRLEIFSLLRQDGPSTAKELAGRLGVDELAVYYHLRLMSRSGIIGSSPRPTATKPEAVYSALGPILFDEINFEDEKDLHEICRNVDALTRTASKDFRSAATQLGNDLRGRYMIGRLAVRLSEPKWRELEARLSELRQWLASESEPEGERYSLTFFALPTVSKTNLEQDK